MVRLKTLTSTGQKERHSTALLRFDNHCTRIECKWRPLEILQEKCSLTDLNLQMITTSKPQHGFELTERARRKSE